MTRKEYYEIMENMKPSDDFDKIHEKWFKCYRFILKSFKIGYTDKVIKSLFYNWTMENWDAMHKENTLYKEATGYQLIEAFCGDC